MTISKEAIQAAALKLRDETGGFGASDDRATAKKMLEAALPFLPIAVEGKVKALVKAAKAAQERMLVEGYSLPEFDSAVAAFDGGADV